MTINMDSIDIDEVLRYMGYKGQEISAELQSMIDEAVSECLESARPAYVYKIFPVRFLDGKVLIADSDLSFESESLFKNLFGCKMCAVLCATIGAGFDHRLNLLQAASPTKAVIFNSCGSTLVEQVVEEVEREILKKTGMKKHGIRFSPGYGDLSVEAQRTVFRLLAPEKHTGISLTSSNMLVPVKSVSAILGLSDEGKDVKMERCAVCGLQNTCEFRKEGNVCEYS